MSIMSYQKRTIGAACAGFAILFAGPATKAVPLSPADAPTLATGTQPAIAAVSEHRERGDRYDHDAGNVEVDAPTTYVRKRDDNVVVEAPFTSVERSNSGVRVRAPFVDLWVPHR